MKFRHRSIMGLIYCCLLAIPMVSILSRVIYVQSNKNAKDSYYGETINQQQIITPTQLNEGESYFMALPNSSVFTQETTHVDITISGLKVNGVDKEFNRLRLFVSSGTTYLNIQFFSYPASGSNYAITSNTNANIEFTYISSNNDYYKQQVCDNLLYQIEYNKYSYLDNAFDYSLSTFVDSNSWGNLNLFQWFTDLFLDINAKNNGLYIQFVNWYMNYVLFVSCAYILFLILMWFINYSRRILERGMNYDW